jgi:hypothetical protein
VTLTFSCFACFAGPGVPVHTPGFNHEWRAVDVNRPVTSLVRPCRGAGWAGTNRYRGIDIPLSPRRVHNRAATVRESGTLHAVTSIRTIVSVSTRTSGCHAPSADHNHARFRSCEASGRCQSAGNVPGALLLRRGPGGHAPLPGDWHPLHALSGGAESERRLPVLLTPFRNPSARLGW